MSFCWFMGKTVCYWFMKILIKIIIWYFSESWKSCAIYNHFLIEQIWWTFFVYLNVGKGLPENLPDTWWYRKSINIKNVWASYFCVHKAFVYIHCIAYYNNICYTILNVFIYQQILFRYWKDILWIKYYEHPPPPCMSSQTQTTWFSARKFSLWQKNYKISHLSKNSE